MSSIVPSFDNRPEDKSASANAFTVPAVPVTPGKTAAGDENASAHPGGDSVVPSGRIMIVDDELANVQVAKKILAQAGHNDFVLTTNSANALNLIHTSQPDVVLLDINMPQVNGITILTQIRSVDELRHLPVLILTANQDRDVKLRCLDLGATDFLVKPIDPMELAPRVRNALQSKIYHDQLTGYTEQLETIIRQRTEELENSRREVIHCLARAAELRDTDTGNHVIRVGSYAGIIARNLGMPEAFIRDLVLAAQLHDVGKIAIPDSILFKRGPLEPDEYETIKGHVKHGRQIIKPFPSHESQPSDPDAVPASQWSSDGDSLMRLAASIAQTHHEKFDGSGYPIGLAGNDIPIEGRITAVADVFDALSSERPYKKAMSRESCFRVLEEGRGTHFDPRVLDAFFDGAGEIVRIQVEYVDYA